MTTWLHTDEQFSLINRSPLISPATRELDVLINHVTIQPLERTNEIDSIRHLLIGQPNTSLNLMTVFLRRVIGSGFLMMHLEPRPRQINRSPQMHPDLLTASQKTTDWAFTVVLHWPRIIMYSHVNRMWFHHTDVWCYFDRSHRNVLATGRTPKPSR